MESFLLLFASILIFGARPTRTCSVGVRWTIIESKENNVCFSHLDFEFFWCTASNHKFCACGTKLDCGKNGCAPPEPKVISKMKRCQQIFALAVQRIKEISCLGFPISVRVHNHKACRSPFAVATKWTCSIFRSGSTFQFFLDFPIFSLVHQNRLGSKRKQEF